MYNSSNVGVSNLGGEMDVGCWMLGGRGVLALRCDKDRDGKY